MNEDYCVQVVDVSVVRSFIEENHYSKSINGCKVSVCYALYDDVYLVGAILYGALSTTAWKKYGTSESDVVELRRLCLLDSTCKNTGSWFISKTIKDIKKRFDFKICISYADPYHDHVGFVYQASNWSFLGKTPKDKLLVTPEGKTYHSRAMRTKYKGKLKPFAQRLKDLNDQGLLTEVVTPGKYIYSYTLDKKHKVTGLTYPKE